MVLKRIILVLPLPAISIMLFCSISLADISKSINLRDFWNVTRNQDFVCGGVPLPKGMISDLAQIQLQNPAGSSVPFQTRPLMRWPDGSFRWLYLAFPADIGAQQTARYTLNLTQNASHVQPTYQHGVVNVVETIDSVTVSTGKMTFVVRKKGKGFNLFNRVLIAKDTDGLVNDEIVSPSLDNGAVIWDKFDSSYTSGNDLTYTVKVEEKGPLYTILKIEGSHSNGTTDLRFYGYLCRIYAYAGKSYLKVQYTVKNSYFHARGVLAMNGMNVRLKANLSGTERVTLYGDSLVNTQPLTDSAYVYQRRQTEFLAKNGTTTVDSGSRALGWIDLSDNNWGVAIGDYEFASNCPNEVGVRSGGWVEGRFFPRRYQQGTADSVNYGETDRFFIGLAEHKTHRFCLYFHSGSAESADVPNVMAAFNHPLLPTMDKEWIALTRAVPGEICPANSAVAEPITTRMPLVNAPLQSVPYTCTTGTNNQYYDTWCSFGEAFWRNDNGAAEIWENQGTRYFRWLSPYIQRLHEANAWLYADFRRCHIDSSVGYYGANGYYSMWAGGNNRTMDPVHSAGLPVSHRWIPPTLGSNTEHFSARDLFTYYLVSGDLKIRDALYDFAQLSNCDMTWWNQSSSPTPGLGGMARMHASSWSTLLMAGFVENTTDTVNGKTLQQYFREIMFDWAQGRPKQVGIFQSMTPMGTWNWGTQPNGTTGTAAFFEALVTMSFMWYLDSYMTDSLQTYINRNASAWRDTLIGEQGAIAYQGVGSDIGTSSSASFWRIPGAITLLAYHANHDSVLMRQLKKHVNANLGYMFNNYADHTYYDFYDLTTSQAYLLQEKYPTHFWSNPIITWANDPSDTRLETPSQERYNAISMSLFPNPFNPNVSIHIKGLLSGQESPVVCIYGMDGRFIRELHEEQAGGYIWNGRDQHMRTVAAGIYMFNVSISGHQLTKMGLLIK